MESQTWPLGYLLTLRTYGTWLPGDARGWVSRRQTVVGTAYHKPSVGLERAQPRRAPPLVLTPSAREAVDVTIREVCSYRGWELAALNVRTNHVHGVVSAPTTPERVINTLKSWCTRRLVEIGLVAAGRPAWVRHGSTAYLWTADQVERACQYVLEAQDGELWDLRHGADSGL